MYWDAEAQDSAVVKARQLASRDPEAASLLVAQVIAEQEMAKDTGYSDPFKEHYNPILLYDRACKEYGWRPRDCDEMHYLTFFAMLREANERHQQENELYRG